MSPKVNTYSGAIPLFIEQKFAQKLIFSFLKSLMKIIRHVGADEKYKAKLHFSRNKMVNF